MNDRLRKNLKKISTSTLLASMLAMPFGGMYAMAAADDNTKIENKLSFTDVTASHWAHDAIQSLVDKGIIKGSSATSFQPKGLVTRAEYASMLVRALNLTATKAAPFKDVAATSWYASATAAAYEHQLIRGVTADTFAPNSPITREEMAVMSKQALEVRAGHALKSSTNASATFNDQSTMSAWAKNAIDIVLDRSVMSGVANKTFQAKSNASRAEAAMVIHNLITDVSVQLLGINDFHGQLDYSKTVKDASGKVVSTLGGAAYLATYLKEREATNPNTLLVHAGDVVGASAPISALMQDEPTIDYLNRLGFDVGTLGNHEFDKGAAEALRLIHGGKNPKTGAEFAGANFPYVVANVLLDGKPMLDPYVIKEIGGVKVGFIGVVTNDTPNVVSPAGLKGVTFTDQVTAVNKAVAELEAKGINAIVVLAHDPFEGSADAPTGEVIDLANGVSDNVDVIFAGHNHGKLNKMINGKLVVEASSYGTAFADVDLTINRATMDIDTKKAEIVDVKQEGVTPDQEIVAMLKDYQDKNAPVMNAPIGTSDTGVTRSANTSGESALGNLIADGMRETMKTDFAFMNSGGIRNDLPQGTVTYGNMFAIQPFGNVLVKMTLTGAQMKALLNEQWSGTSAKIGQVSGFTYTYDDSKPAGQKVLEIKKTDGTVLKDTDQYTIVVNDFMATGGDGYVTLTKGTDRVAGPVDLDATIDYVKNAFKSGSISAKVEDRFKKVN